MSYSLDGVFGGLGTAGFGVELTDCVSLARVLDDSTELSEGSSSIASSLSAVDSFLLTGTAVGVFDIVAPLLFNNDASIPYGKHKPLHNSNTKQIYVLPTVIVIIYNYVTWKSLNRDSSSLQNA